MVQDQLILDLVEWGASVAFIVTFCFPVLIRFIWAWERHDWGWNIMCFDFCVSSALLPTFLHDMFGVDVDTDFFSWSEVVSIWLIPVVVAWRSIMIYRKQRGH